MIVPAASRKMTDDLDVLEGHRIRGLHQPEDPGAVLIARQLDTLERELAAREVGLLGAVRHADVAAVVRLDPHGRCRERGRAGDGAGLAGQDQVDVGRAGADHRVALVEHGEVDLEVARRLVGRVGEQLRRTPRVGESSVPTVVPPTSASSSSVPDAGSAGVVSAGRRVEPSRVDRHHDRGIGRDRAPRRLSSRGVGASVSDVAARCRTRPRGTPRCRRSPPGCHVREQVVEVGIVDCFVEVEVVGSRGSWRAPSARRPRSRWSSLISSGAASSAASASSTASLRASSRSPGSPASNAGVEIVARLPRPAPRGRRTRRALAAAASPTSGEREHQAGSQHRCCSLPPLHMSSSFERLTPQISTHGRAGAHTTTLQRAESAQ